jgi:hypothetical protein
VTVTLRDKTRDRRVADAFETTSTKVLTTAARWRVPLISRRSFRPYDMQETTR